MRGGRSRGQLPDHVRDWRLRLQLRDQFLKLPFRLVLRHLQHFPVVLGREMASEEAYRSQVHRAIAEHIKNDRELPAGPGSPDATVGRRLGEMQDLCAVREERSAPFGQVQAPLVEFREMGDEDRCHLPLFPRQMLHPREEVMVGQLSHSG